MCRADHGKTMKASWKIMEKSWNLILGNRWEPCLCHNGYKKRQYIAIQSLYVTVFMAYAQHKRVRVMSFVNVLLKVPNNVRWLSVLTICENWSITIHWSGIKYCACFYISHWDGWNKFCISCFPIDPSK